MECERGFTFIEVIIAIVIIGIAVAGVLSVMNLTVSRSADPMIQEQAVAIAEAYLEEIRTKAFSDPDGSETGEGRATYDDVEDYDGLTDTGAHDQNNQAITGLAGYTVQVTVQAEDLNGLGAGNAKRIDVEVTHGSGVDITVSGYRANY
jgi:MSHA pilin protein MshD